MARYRVLQGIDYPPNKRAEVGDIVEDIPAQSVKWLLDSEIIEDTDKPTKKIEKTVVEEIKAELVAEVVEEPIVTDGFDVAPGVCATRVECALCYSAPAAGEFDST